MTGAPALRAAFQFAKCCGDTDANGIDKLINRESAKFRKRERQQSHSLLSSGKKFHAEARRRGDAEEEGNGSRMNADDITRPRAATKGGKRPQMKHG